LVELDRDDSFKRYIINKGWGNSWGIFFRSPERIEKLRRHLHVETSGLGRRLNVMRSANTNPPSIGGTNCRKKSISGRRRVVRNEGRLMVSAQAAGTLSVWA